MSAFSTLHITRTKAKELLIKKLMDDIDDTDLAEFMDILLSPRLYNCRIVPDGEPHDDELLQHLGD